SHEKLPMSSSFRIASAVTACLASLAWPFHLAEAAGGANPAPMPARADALDFRMRAELRDEYVDYQRGGGANMIVPRLDYAVTPAFSLRVEAPLVTSGPELAGESNQSGFGDLLFRASYRVVRAGGYAAVVGAELILDTASKDSLGYGKEVLAPLAYASIDIPRCRSVLFPFIQHYFTVGGDDSRPDVNYTSIKAAMLTSWPERFYTVVEPQLIVDHERADRVGMTLEAEGGRFLTRRLAVWGRPGVGLYGDDLPQVYNWNLKVGVRYTF
ncbi:MAG TPA: hypothetical protein VF460_13875, partial [Burkholderiales bacterium]